MQTGIMNPGDLTRLPPRYNGTAEQIQPEPRKMPNAMTVEGYIAGIGMMASESLKDGKGHGSARLMLTTMLIGIVFASAAGFFAFFRVAFGG